MATTYTWAPDNTRMRAVSIVPFGVSGLVLPLWPHIATDPFGPKYWTYSGVSLASAAVSGLTSTCGFGAAVSDGASGAWMMQYTGSLVHLLSNSTVASFAYPAGKIFTGMAYNLNYSTTYTAASDGTIYQGTGGTQVSAGFGVPVWGLASLGTTLYGLAVGGLATFNLSTINTGVVGSLITTPLQTALCMAAYQPASAVALGGWQNTTLGSGYVNIAFSPVSAVMVGVNASNKVDLYLGPNEIWTLTQTVPVTGAPQYAAWNPAGTQVLVTDPVSGVVWVYNYSLGALTLNQTIPLAGAGPISIASAGSGALVARPTLNSITALSLGVSGWSVGSTASVSSPQSVIMTSPSAGVAAGNNGVVFLNISGGVLSVTSTTNLAYNPNQIIAASGNILACGTSGPSAFFSAVSGATVLFNYSWGGAGTCMIYDQGQVTVSDATPPGLLYAFGNLFTNYMFVFNIVPATTFPSMAVSPYTPFSSGGTIFAMGTLDTYQYTYTSPFNLEPLRKGAVAYVNASGVVTTTALGSGHVPTAITFDTSGAIWVATLQNNLYKVNAAGGIASSQTITQFSGQAQTTPLGVSALAFVGSGLYAASSLAGPLTRLF